MVKQCHHNTRHEPCHINKINVPLHKGKLGGSLQISIGDAFFYQPS